MSGDYRRPGGLPAMRPEQAPQPMPDRVISPGSPTIFRGRLVVIFGTGAGTGLFVYSGNPALGNPPILAVTTASVDPYGNVVTPSAITDAGMPLLVYSGPPAAGNLVASFSGAAGTDAFGNSYVAGTGSYASSGAVTAINGATTVVYSGHPAGGTSDNMVASISPANTTDSVGNTVQAGLAVYQTQGGVGLVETVQIVGSILQWINANTGNKLVLAQDTTNNNLFVQSAGAASSAAIVEISNPASLAIVESWHPFTLTASCTAGNDINGNLYTPAYRLTNGGNLKLQGVVVAPAAGLASGTTWAVIPAAYRPATNIPVALISNGSHGTLAHVYVRPNGNMQFNSALGATVSMFIDCELNIAGT